MPLPALNRERRAAALLNGIARTLLTLAGLALLAAATLASPALLRLVDNGRSDWARLGDIGQAYGPVSALLSALALCVAVFVQRRQLRQERILMAREMHATALQTAMEDPAYSQCWGPRVSPRHIDERFFYYTNMIITAWLYAWECGDLSDGAVRSYARAMADSEVPREYWRQHGAWRMQAARGRRHRFLTIVDAEFRAAEAVGAATRAVEQPPTSPAAEPSCCRHCRPPHRHRVTELRQRTKSRH